MKLASLDPGLRTDALEDIWSYAVGGSGKQTRTKVLLSAEVAVRAGRGEPDARIDFAVAAVELVHLATLQHDDVIDDSGVRRGVVSIPARYGAPLAAAAGGLFCGRALTLLARCGQEAVTIAVKTAECLCEGQMLELRDRYNIERTPVRCLQVAKDKTASVFRLAAELGAMLGGADETARRHFRQYGIALGIGFQLVDDILDLTGDQELLGKPCGNDLDNGNYTLPVIYALEERPKLGLLLQEDVSAKSVVDEILKTEAIRRTSDDARAWISQAKDAIREVPRAQGLLTIADAELERLNTRI
jgi:heptaprenyl diphosphate synthase component 2